MFDHDIDYPTAIASYDDDGVAAAIEWSVRHMEDGDTLSVWTSLKSNLRNCAELERLVQRHRNVEHITGRGGGVPAGPGPVLMAWADMDDVGELVRYSRGIRALCVIAWNMDRIRPWVAAMKPDILGDGSSWESLGPELDPVVVKALKGLTRTVNHNNTISAGFEKDQVVGVLLALRDGRVPMDADAMQGWALAHGWSGKNPERLAQYVHDINAGKRPRTRSVIRAGYIDTLRERVESGSDDRQS
ncbi:MAG: hypothetical protein WAW17_17050 [Rhodococcus sp. (in: high G+C Gram-positive bacteria)]|uniref:hypothetical protein n=1 Tax=Rhodococcus sp. TaxID=1831 RepID=UPI003BB0F1ED